VNTNLPHFSLQKWKPTKILEVWPMAAKKYPTQGMIVCIIDRDDWIHKKCANSWWVFISSLHVQFYGKFTEISHAL